MENFNARKYKLFIKIGMPLLAVISIMLFVFLPIKFLNKALEKEAVQKDREIERVIDVNFFDWI